MPFNPPFGLSTGILFSTRLLQIPKLPLEDPEASFTNSESLREEIRQQLPLLRVLFLISFYAISFSRVMDQTEISGRR